MKTWYRVLVEEGLAYVEAWMSASAAARKERPA